MDTKRGSRFSVSQNPLQMFSTSDRAARDFLDGASASAEKRQREESTNRYSKKRDHKNDAIEDTVSGALTALFRGLFSSESDDN